MDGSLSSDQSSFCTTTQQARARCNLVQAVQLRSTQRLQLPSTNNSEFGVYSYITVAMSKIDFVLSAQIAVQF